MSHTSVMGDPHVTIYVYAYNTAIPLSKVFEFLWGGLIALFLSLSLLLYTRGARLE